MHDLFQSGARLTPQDHAKLLDDAQANKSWEALDILLQLKPGPPVNDGSLHQAVSRLNIQVAEYLLELGHDPNHFSPEHGGKSALTQICSQGNYKQGCDKDIFSRDMTKLLLRHGADPELENGGKLPVFWALENGGVILGAFLDSIRTETGIDPQTFLFKQNGLCYSPYSYLERIIRPNARQYHYTAIGLIRVKELLAKHSLVVPKYYALEGPQPADAVGIPPDIHQKEEERKLAEFLHGKQCHVLGEQITDFKHVHGTLTSTCTHAWDHIICTSCLEQYIESQTTPENNLVSDRIICWAPSCNEVLNHEEIKRYAKSEVFARYDEALLRQAIHHGQSFIECSTRGCKGGGWVGSGDIISYFVCEVCHSATCVEHNGPYMQHAGRPCPNAAARRAKSEAERKKREKVDKANEKLLNRLSKACPFCGRRIEKVKGCDHMTCPCKGEFCWICLVPYSEIRSRGNSAHHRKCKHHK